MTGKNALITLYNHSESFFVKGIMYSSVAAGGGFSVSHPSLCVTRREEPSIKDDWMEKINDVRCCYIIHIILGKASKNKQKGGGVRKIKF